MSSYQTTLLLNVAAGGGTVCRSTMFPDLYYSYETCGSPYDTAQSLGANLENRVLRAGMPTM
jgi:hypothetical protein